MGLETDTFEFIERCHGYKSTNRLLDDLLSCARKFGFEHLILSGVPVANEELEPLVELNGWPKSWFSRYTNEKYAQIDSVCRYCAVSSGPFFWSEVPERLRDTPGARRVAREASDFGLVNGFVVPAYSRLRWQSVVSFASPFPRIVLSDRERSAITLMSAIAISSVEAMLCPPEREKPLSRREKEVLLWTARGKSAEDIAAILCISIATVRKHLQNIREIYSVTNTLGAVAAALRRRHIIL